jgi:hypothetical protein
MHVAKELGLLHSIKESSHYSDCYVIPFTYLILVEISRVVTCYLYIFETISKYYFFPVAQQSLLGQGVLVIEASRSHSDTPHSVGLLWTTDQPDAKTST